MRRARVRGSFLFDSISRQGDVMSHGGARYGAGRPGWRAVAEDLRRIDVRHWARIGALEPGEAGRVHWPDGRYVGYGVEGDVLALAHDFAGRPLVQHISILRTPCNYGGTRPWFACPRCSRRAAVLHLRWGGFACRRCNAVANACQSEGAAARAWRQQRKAERRLGLGHARPKRMRHATYQALLATITDAMRQRTRAMSLMLRQTDAPATR